LKTLNDYKSAVVFRSALYVLAGIGTIIPAVSVIGFSTWGGGTIGAALSLLGSITLILASIVQLTGVQFVGQRTKEAALLALGGSLAVWSFYLPADVSLTRMGLSDRRLELTVVQWKEFGSSLSVERQGPEFQLSTEEFQELQAAGIKGKVSVRMARAEYGRGKRSSVLILIQRAVSGPITLKEPDASNIVYFQTGGEWKKYPNDAPTLNRAIELSPSQSDSLQTQVFVELVTGARIGFGVWLPKSEVRSPE
jgi:hypothetical protein